MRAYETEALPAGIEKRLQFNEGDRDLTTYTHVLDLIGWAEWKVGLPRDLAIPVEDPSDPSRRLKLLPGAPAAFALDKVVLVEDTKDLQEYFDTDGRNVDPEIVRLQKEFFERYGFRSFASFPLKFDGIKKGVLNVQSAKPFIFGKGAVHEKMVTELLLPLRTALALLV